jgi:hypothetical protein
VPEELVGAEVLDVDIDQLAAAATDGVAAHLLEVIREPQEGEGLAHVDGAPHRRVLAEVVPRRAHHLCARQDLECLKVSSGSTPSRPGAEPASWGIRLQGQEKGPSRDFLCKGYQTWETEFRHV